MAAPKKSRTARTTSYIPEEIVSNILVRLPIEDLARFRYVCKSWHSLISTSSFADAVFASSPADEDNIIYTVKDRVHTTDYVYDYFCFNLRKCYARPKSLPIPYAAKHGIEPKELVLWSSCNGLLLFTHLHKPNQLYISNPLTAEFVALPPCSKLIDSAKWALVHDARLKKYKVYGICSDGTYFLLTQGANSWKEREIISPRKRLHIVSKIFALNNKLRWLTADVDDDTEYMSDLLVYYMFSLNVESGRTRRIKISPDDADANALYTEEDYDHLLTDVKGALCFLIVTPENIDFHVPEKNERTWYPNVSSRLFIIRDEKPPVSVKSFLSRDICLVATRGTSMDEVDHMLKLLVHRDGWLFIYEFKNEKWRRKIRSPSKGSRLSGYYVFHSSSLVRWETKD